MRAATLSGFGQGAGPVLSVRFEPPEFDPPQAVASRVSARTMNEERRRILAILGVSDTLSGHYAVESHRLSGEAKIPLVPFHYRHACASWLLGAGKDVVAVTERLGLWSPTLRLSTYAHAVWGRQGELAKAIGTTLK